MQILSSECKLTKLIVQIGCPSYHLTSWRKSALIHKPSGQIPKVLYQHETVEKIKKKYLGISALIQPIAQHTYIGNKHTHIVLGLMFILQPLHFSSRGGRTPALSSE